jgi:ABC-2 type transport system permease protein
MLNLELKKLLKQKHFLTGSGMILFYTALSSMGFIMHRMKKGGKKFDGALLSELMNGVTFSMCCLVPGIYMLLPMIIAIFTAAALAGEFQNGQLRTTLLRPVSRWNVYLCKFSTMCAYSFTMLAILLVITYISGAVMFGAGGDVIIFGKLFLGKKSMFILNQSIAWQRMLLAYLLAGFSTVYLVAMYMMFAAISKKVAHTIVISLGIYYTSYILMSIPFMKHIHSFLPTRYLAVWKFAVMENIPWGTLSHDILINCAYIFAYLIIGGITFNMADV